VPTTTWPPEYVGSGVTARISRARHCGIDRGKVGGTTWKARAEWAEVFRSSGNRGAGLELRMVVKCDETAGELLATKKFPKKEQENSLSSVRCTSLQRLFGKSKNLPLPQ
jgi:hypothetical protein